MKKVVVSFVVLLVGFLMATRFINGETSMKPASQIVYNLGADFSFVDNPNGVWQYGYSATNRPNINTNEPLAEPLAPPAFGGRHKGFCK